MNENNYVAKFSVFDISLDRGWERFEEEYVSDWQEAMEIANEKLCDGEQWVVNTIVSTTCFNELGEPLRAYTEDEWRVMDEGKEVGVQ